MVNLRCRVGGSGRHLGVCWSARGRFGLQFGGLLLIVVYKIRDLMVLLEVCVMLWIK